MGGNKTKAAAIAAFFEKIFAGGQNKFPFGSLLPWFHGQTCDQ